VEHAALLTKIALVPSGQAAVGYLRDIRSTYTPPHRYNKDSHPHHHPHCNDQTHVATAATYESPEGPGVNRPTLAGEGGGFSPHRVFIVPAMHYCYMYISIRGQYWAFATRVSTAFVLILRKHNTDIPLYTSLPAPVTPNEIKNHIHTIL